MSLVQQKVVSTLGFKNQLIKYRTCGDGCKINPQVDDNATLILEFLNGQQAIVRSSWNVYKPQDHLIIHGRKGNIVIDAWEESIVLETLERLPNA